MPDILKSLNPAQRKAVTATEGYIRVIAGAGSGKTRALSHRFAFLVNELGMADEKAPHSHRAMRCLHRKSFHIPFTRCSLVILPQVHLVV